MTALAVVIVAYDSGEDLERALPPLLEQLRPDDEVVVVDNASSQPVGDWPAVRVLRLAENTGFAGGAAAGVLATSAPLVLLLNPDAIVQPDCLEALRATAAAQPGWGAWQAVVALEDGVTLNTAGNAAHWTGLGWAGGHGQPVPAELGAAEVGFASGAALAVRRAAWDAVGGFDPDYFMYAEDLDLSLRLRLRGWEVGVAPGALVHHGYDFAKGDYKWFYLERNRWWTVLADYPGPLLALVLPALLVLDVALLAVAAAGGWLPAKLRAQAAVLRSLPATLRRRRRVQAARTVSPAAFAAAFTATLDSPFLGPAARFGPAVLAQRAYWALVRALLARSSTAAKRSPTAGQP